MNTIQSAALSSSLSSQLTKLWNRAIIYHFIDLRKTCNLDVLYLPSKSMLKVFLLWRNKLCSLKHSAGNVTPKFLISKRPLVHYPRLSFSSAVAFFFNPSIFHVNQLNVSPAHKIQLLHLVPNLI